MTLSENLVTINKLREGLDRLRPLSEQAEKALWEKLRLEWNYNSNHIEGNTLTYGETMLFLLKGKTTGDHEKREYDEMEAHDLAIQIVREWAADPSRELTETDIKNINKIILVKPYWKEAITRDGQPTRRLIRIGDYKEFPNSVRLKNGEIFHYASPDETGTLMNELIEWYNATEIRHPVYLAAELHYKFIRIHPFDDGNGRVARLLVNYILMRHGYTPIIIKSADKESYITALQKADSGDKAAFPNYIAEQQIWSLELELKAAKGESIEESDDLDKEIDLLNKRNKRQIKLTTERTNESIYDAIQENIIPLFILIEKRANKLRESFFDYNRTIEYQTFGSNIYSVGSKATTWETITENWLNKEIRNEGKQVTNLNYTYELLGLKSTISGRNMFLSLNIYFDRYNYRIQTSINNQPKIFPYGKEISEVEKENLINPMIKDLVEQIKNLG